MTDLQIGLLVIGAAAVAGVLVYNRLQERATRRQAERAFGSQHADVLLDAPPARRESTMCWRGRAPRPAPFAPIGRRCSAAFPAGRPSRRAGASRRTPRSRW